MWRRALVAIALVLPAGLAWANGQQPEPAGLNAYRVQAQLPAACAKLGGKLDYATHATHCNLPQLTAKTPSSAVVTGRPAPVTTRH